MAPRETQSSPYVPPGGLQDVSEVDITGRSCFRRPTTARCLRSQHQGRIPDPFDRPSASRDALNLGGLRENEYTRAVVDILQQSYLGPNPGSEVHTSCKIFLGNCRKIVEERFLAELYRVVLEAAARNESGSSQHRFLANVIDQGRPSEVIAEVKQLWRPSKCPSPAALPVNDPLIVVSNRRGDRRQCPQSSPAGMRTPHHIRRRAHGASIRQLRQRTAASSSKKL